MGKSSKILVVILIVIAFFIIGTLLLEKGASKTFVWLFALGLFYGITTMFEKPDKKQENNDKKEGIKLNKNKNDSDENTQNQK